MYSKGNQFNKISINMSSMLFILITFIILVLLFNSTLETISNPDSPHFYIKQFLLFH